MMGNLKQRLDNWCAAVNAWLDSPIAQQAKPSSHTCLCGTKCHVPKGPAALTDAQQVIISAWWQFAYHALRKDGKPRMYAGGLSALEEMEGYLQEHGLIDADGIPKET
jgi:hypothetical protein